MKTEPFGKAMIDSTSESLLLQLKSARSDRAWERFVELYTPLLFFWARKCGLHQSDAADLVQDVLAKVVQKLPEWEYDRARSFRGWLRMITMNRHRELLRRSRSSAIQASDSLLANLASEQEAESHWDTAYVRDLVAAAIETQEPNFAPATWHALMQWIRSGRPVSEIATQSGVSVWTIYAAKTRLLSRLRRELDGLLE